MDSCFSGRWCT